MLSRGVNCEDSSEVYPDIYMNVKYYFKWILDNMNWFWVILVLKKFKEQNQCSGKMWDS